MRAKSRRILTGVLSLLCVTTPGIAQEITPAESSLPLETGIAEEVSRSRVRIAVTAGAAVVGEYISRGISFAEEPSLQPYLTISLDLPGATGGAIRDVQLFVGTWSNIKLGSVEPGEARQLTRFYETDLYAGATVGLGERLLVSAAYYRYESLSDSFKAYNDFELILSFDDSEMWKNLIQLDNFTMSPALRLVQEAGRPGRPDALYVQPSLSPSFDLGHGTRALRVTVPLVLGFSDKYYDNARGGHETYGFFRTGAKLSVRPFPSEAAGLEISGGADVWFLNDEVVNGLGASELVGRFGVNWRF